jgi:hypothetical protein
VTGRWFSPGPPVSSTNKTDRHDITEILLNTINQTKPMLHKGKYNYSSNPFISHFLLQLQSIFKMQEICSLNVFVGADMRV